METNKEIHPCDRRCIEPTGLGWPMRLQLSGRTRSRYGVDFRLTQLCRVTAYVSLDKGDIVDTFPDWSVTIERLVAEDDWVAERKSGQGNPSCRCPVPPLMDDLRGVAPTGKTVEVWQSHYWRIRDGRIVEHEAVRDDLGIFSASLGCSPENEQSQGGFSASPNHSAAADNSRSCHSWFASANMYALGPAERRC